jgi:hypothetical protein
MGKLPVLMDVMVDLSGKVTEVPLVSSVKL